MKKPTKEVRGKGEVGKQENSSESWVSIKENRRRGRR